jgi:Tol biopolymer transport system component
MRSLTGVVVDPQNGTGTQTTTTTFDFSTGLVTSQTDANGKVSTIDYTNQLLNRTALLDEYRRQRTGAPDDNAANDEVPNWSPDNSRIVFQSDRNNLFSGSADIYVMNADGSGQTRLTSDVNDDSAPIWSPDGTKIAFQSSRNGVNYQVYVMNADGSGQVNISNNSSNEKQPSWSPDGTKLAFASDRDQPGFPSIYVMNANGSNQTRLTFSASGRRDEQPAWSPDGLKLAFTSRFIVAMQRERRCQHDS